MFLTVTRPIVRMYAPKNAETGNDESVLSSVEAKAKIFR
jgi:hypothetical protein